MRLLQFVKLLEVQSARYELSDAQGDEVLLLVDYKNNQFRIESSTQKNADFRAEVEKFALGLLARKHGANLAKKEQLL
jgi:hypothetical protein